MSEISKQQTPTLHEETSGAGSTADNRFDVSMETVPEGWVEAQSASPVGLAAINSLARSPRFATIPTPSESPYVANVTALGASFITGTVWYLVALFDVYDGPWIATLAAAIISLAVQLAGGADRTYRAALSVTFYLITLLIVLLMITHRQLIDVYGTAGGFRNYEDVLVRTRLQNPVHMLAYGLGALLSVQISFFHRPGR